MSFLKSRLLLFAKFFLVNYYKYINVSRTFDYNGKKLNYFYHSYNTTWRNERIIEVPVILEYVNQFKNKRILEVGNVLSHYIDFEHDVVDKYEKAPNVNNVDIVDFTPAKKYDLIISISTLEHVGWDEEKKDPDKIHAAISNLKKCLDKDGMLVATLPIGYNSWLDDYIRKGELGMKRIYCFKRVSFTKWKETDLNESIDSKYDYPYTCANSIIVAVDN